MNARADEAGKLAIRETEKLIELSRCLDVSLDYLLRGEERAEGSFYSDVKSVGRRLASETSKKRIKKGLRLALILGGAVLAIDLISMLIYFLICGIPQ